MLNTIVNGSLLYKHNLFNLINEPKNDEFEAYIIDNFSFMETVELIKLCDFEVLIAEKTHIIEYLSKYEGVETKDPEELKIEYPEFFEFPMLRLKDLQGGNLGDIEHEIFTDIDGIVDRLEIYWDDYCIKFFDKLEDFLDSLNKAA